MKKIYPVLPTKVRRHHLLKKSEVQFGGKSSFWDMDKLVFRYIYKINTIKFHYFPDMMNHDD